LGFERREYSRLFPPLTAFGGSFLFSRKNLCPQTTQTTQKEQIDQSLVTRRHSVMARQASSPTIWVNGRRRGSDAEVTPGDAEVTQVTQGDAEVTQPGLEINGLRGLLRLSSHAILFRAKRSSQMRREEN
jgi:hypothetical protein